MVLSKMSWMVLGLGALGLAGCGGADWAETAQESEVADESAAITATPKYLSLGDSIAFGFNPLVSPVPVSNYIGYPEYIASKGKKVTNGSCPGETSSSFLSASEPDNGCKGFKAQFALHADYETTQIAFTSATLLKVKNKPAEQFDFITLNLGANDLFLLQAGCKGDLACIQAGLPGVIKKYGDNLDAGYNQVKNDVGKAKFIGVSTYAINYNDPLAVGALSQINAKLKAFAVKVKGKWADGFTAFQIEAAKYGGDSCAAGLLIKKPDNTCDIHPSEKGRKILGEAVLGAQLATP